MINKVLKQQWCQHVPEQGIELLGHSLHLNMEDVEFYSEKVMEQFKILRYSKPKWAQVNNLTYEKCLADRKYRGSSYIKLNNKLVQPNIK